MNLVKKLKSNPKLFFTILRIQSRLRGLIIRKKVKAFKINSKFQPNDSNTNFFISKSNKIVK